ncbi:MAG: arginine--tRNA ligase [Erysipelotrichales bacterium]|nr:arginine--tRNA ligase [Erysipelotrichales bacterium]
MLEKIKNEIRITLEDFFLKNNNQKLNVTVEEPKQKEMGDFAIPLFVLFKNLKDSYPKITDLFEKISEVLKSNELFESSEFVNGFANLRLNKETFAKKVLTAKIAKKDSGKTIVIDYSAPNIAKNFSVGHLRSTIIGNALKNLYRNQGYKVIGVNHLGDWGTQYGKMIVAYQKWGNPETIKQNPIIELQKLYVRFHEEAKANPELDDLARATFKKLEDKDAETLKLWEYFRTESLKEFDRIYQVLGVDFEYVLGESFYNDKTDAVIKELTDKKLLEEDAGAMIVRLPDLVPALIQKTDGTTLYLTRELATVLYRHDNYHFDSLIYVVGNEQKNHFDQLRAVIKRMGHAYADLIEHINFGLVLLDGKKMSTRNGRTILLQEVIDEAYDLALKQIEVKNPGLADKEKTAMDIAVGAVIFNDLKNQRQSDFEFDLEAIVRFEGATGPYIQYTLVRIKAILLANPLLKTAKPLYSLYQEEVYFEVLRQVSRYEEILEKATFENAPHHLCKYLLNLAVAFNQFYSQIYILNEDEKIRNTNLLLLARLEVILAESLTILGLKVLERM